jgi:hypothetical protein
MERDGANRTGRSKHALRTKGDTVARSGNRYEVAPVGVEWVVWDFGSQHGFYGLIVSWHATKDEADKALEVLKGA